MSPDKLNIEDELLLYISNELPEKRKKYIEALINSNKKVKAQYELYLEFDKQIAVDDNLIDEEDFKATLNMVFADEKQSVTGSGENKWLTQFKTFFAKPAGKFAVAASIILFTVVFRVAYLNEVNTPETKDISEELLEWDSPYLNGRFNSITGKMKEIKDSYGKDISGWTDKINEIENRLNQISIN